MSSIELRGVKNMSGRCAVKKYKLNNKGSAIVTVLVVVTFITILATIMLYISASNIQMKAADYRTKESFYQAEIPVEELKAQLVEDVQLAFAKAYTAAMSEYAGFGDAQNAEDNYRRLFCEEMNKIWAGRCPKDEEGNRVWEVGIHMVAKQPTDGGTWSVAVAPSEKFDESKIFTEGWLVLRNVEFIYDSSEGYTSIISTDFCITIPEVQWPDANGHYGAAGSGTEERLNFSSCVNYMNWTKQ